MTQMRHIGRLLLLSALGLALSACGGPAAGNMGAGGTSANAGGSKTAIQAVATTSIIADLVKNVGGERVAVRAILPAGADPHTYAPAPNDVQGVAEADILFENGGGLEEWLSELTRNAGGERPTIVVSRGITMLPGGEAEHGADEHANTEAAHEDEAGAQSGDPHMWFDVQNTMRYVENIRDGLKQVDPSGAEVYDANATAYLEQLRQLDQELLERVGPIPAERRKLLTNHDTFGYFAKRHGFTIVGSVFEGISTEEEPSAQQIAELVRTIETENVPAIFTENTVNPRLAEQVGAEAGIKVVTNLYTDALGEPGSEGDTYVKMMRFNTEQIVSALK